MKRKIIQFFLIIRFPNEEYKYKDDKLIEQIWMNKEGVVTSNRTFAHNDKGDEILITLYRQVAVKDPASVKVTKYRYDEYDQYGNWIQRSTLDTASKVIRMTKRSVTYWK